MLQIIQLENKYKAKWDDYIGRSSEGTFFHLSGWKEVIETTLGLRAMYLMARDEGHEIRGVLPLFLMKDIIGKKYLVSIPYSPYAGVCADNKETEKLLFDAAKEMTINEGAQYLEMRRIADEAYSLPSKKEFVTMRLKLDKNEENVWHRSLSSKARNHVRKASKNGLSVDSGSKYLDDFYEVLSVNIRDLGSPNYPKAFLQEVLERFNGSSDIIVVKHNNKVIGGMLYMGYKNIFNTSLTSSLKKYNRLSPNDLLYWEAMKYACRNGFDHFDFGRSTKDTGTFAFKKKME